MSVVMTVDESTYEGGHQWRVSPHSPGITNLMEVEHFTRGVGHTEASFAEPLVLQHILGGHLLRVG